jgi:hypothetical protein
VSKLGNKVAEEVHYAMCETGFGSICSWPPSDPKRLKSVRKIANAAIAAVERHFLDAAKKCEFAPDRDVMLSAAEELSKPR